MSARRHAILGAFAACAALAPGARAGEKPTLSISCSVGKDRFLLGEPITLRCIITGDVEKFPGEPWLFETGALQIYAMTGQTFVPRICEYAGRYSPITRGLRVPAGGRLLFEREVLVGDVLRAPKGGHATFEERAEREGVDALRARSRLVPGAYTFRCVYTFHSRTARRLLGDHLQALCRFVVGEVPEEEREAFDLFALRPLDTRESRELVEKQFEDLCRRFPDSVYAPWARYYIGRMKLEDANYNGLDDIGAAARSDEARHCLPTYEMAYLPALFCEKYGRFDQGLRFLDRVADKDTLVFLDTLRTGEQLEGWRFFELQRRLREAIEFSEPLEDAGRR